VLDRIFTFFFGKKFRGRFEKLTLYLAIGSFIIHLILIILHDLHWIDLGASTKELFISPVTAIYTPFSFILIYEVYLLIYHLQDSFTISIGKQFEIISLIIIRRIFKDISMVDLHSDWHQSSHNLLLASDMLTIVLLFLLIYGFYRLRQQKPEFKPRKSIERFVRFKKLISVVLAPILFGLAIYSLADWLMDLQKFNMGEISQLKDINKIFYNEFFTLMVLFDVLILMVSFKYTDNYSQLIRNSGFIISTILIRLSFSAEGILNPLLILIAVLFGVLMLWIYNLVGALEIHRSA
jgi:hypothetical protein